MATGPGKYDHLTTFVRQWAQAQGVAVIVFGGQHGNGFSVQADEQTTLAMPEILEEIARQIRKDNSA